MRPSLIGHLAINEYDVGRNCKHLNWLGIVVCPVWSRRWWNLATLVTTVL